MVRVLARNGKSVTSRTSTIVQHFALNVMTADREPGGFGMRTVFTFRPSFRFADRT
jgi:hypothetical protein